MGDPIIRNRVLRRHTATTELPREVLFMSLLFSSAATDRRNFISRASRGAFAVTLGPQILRVAAAQESGGSPSQAPQSVPAGGSFPQEKRIGFAVVGVGNLTQKELIPAFRVSKKAKLTALVSGDAAKAQKLAHENNLPADAIYDYKNFDRIRENKNVQVVYIVLPNSMHGEVTERSARAGKHVLCEKPMEITSMRCQQMIDACKKADVKLMIAYRIQYEPMNRTMQRMVREKVFGPVKFVEADNGQRVEKMQWRLSKTLSGSGAVGDVGVYCINTIRFLLGEEPTEVFGRTFRPSGDPRFKEVDASVIWQMRFPSGVLANCMCSFDAHNTTSYRVVAERGNFGMDPSFRYRGLKMFAHPDDSPLPQIAESNQFAEQLDHMADCVLNNRKPYTPGEEGLQDQRIIEAIFESARTSRAVTLPRFDKIDPFRGPPPA
jgi:predicted dehydrogenase